MNRPIALLFLTALALVGAAPAHSQAIGGVYADYDSELREATARADGIYHVDTPALIEKLKAGHITTYAFLIWHQETDWDDFRLEFLPAAQAAGLTVWLYLTPPGEADPPPYGGTYVPYGLDYVTWATETAKLASAYPALTALAMDDFNANEWFFTPSYVGEMMTAAHAINSQLAFLPVNYDVSDSRGTPVNGLSVAFAQNYGALIDGVIFPYLHWARMSSSSDEGKQIAANYKALHGESAQFVVTYPWSRPSVTGDYSSVWEVISQAGGFPNKAYPFTFRVSDDYDGPTTGYHKTQVLVDGTVAWHGDVGRFTDVQYKTLNLQRYVRGKTSVTITVRVYDVKEVSNFGATVSWDLPAGSWTLSEHGQFVGTGAYYPAYTGKGIPLIVMIYDGGYGAWSPTSAYLRNANLAAYRAMVNGQAAGIIQYCLDKSAGSTQFPIISKLYGRWQNLTP